MESFKIINKQSVDTIVVEYNGFTYAKHGNQWYWIIGSYAEEEDTLNRLLDEYCNE